jgi:hypothetical protein
MPTNRVALPAAGWRGNCPRIAQETQRRTSRMCVTACRRVQQAQRLRSCASGADGRFAAYKAEDGGSSPSAPTSTDNILRGCDAPGEGWADLQVRQKSVRGSKCSERSRLDARYLPKSHARYLPKSADAPVLPCRGMVTAGFPQPCIRLVVAVIEGGSCLWALRYSPLECFGLIRMWSRSVLRVGEFIVKGPRVCNSAVTSERGVAARVC